MGSELDRDIDVLVDRHPDLKEPLLRLLQYLVSNFDKAPEIISRLQRLPTSKTHSGADNRLVSLPLDTAQLDLQPSENVAKGYSVFRVELPNIEQGSDVIPHGEVNSQVIKRKKCFYYIQSQQRSRPWDDVPFRYPHFGPQSEPPELDSEPQQLEGYVERTLETSTSNSRSTKYFIAPAHLKERREKLGLPFTGIEPSAYLLRTQTHYPGIHSPYVYVSTGTTFTSYHQEDFGLLSVNVLYAGMPKIWILVEPQSKRLFESHIAQQQKLSPTCDQFVRHCNLIVPPSVLRQWGVRFHIHVHRPGEVMVTFPNTYHAVINTGPNLAEALNFAEDGWNVEPLYRGCSNKCGSSDDEHLSVSEMRIGKLRSLEINESEEASSSEQDSDGGSSSEQDSDEESSSEQDSDKSEVVENKATTPVTLKANHGPRSRQQPHRIKVLTARTKKQATARHITPQVEASTSYALKALDRIHKKIQEKKKAGSNLVTEIQQWIDFGLENAEQIVLPGARQPDSAELQHSLPAFNPTLLPERKTWLNDVIVNALVRAFTIGNDDVEVLDSLVFASAFKRRRDSDLHLSSDTSPPIYIAPCHFNGNHWLLLIANISCKRIDIFDAKNGRDEAEFLGAAIGVQRKEQILWNYCHHKVSYALHRIEAF